MSASLWSYHLYCSKPVEIPPPPHTGVLFSYFGELPTRQLLKNSDKTLSLKIVKNQETKIFCLALVLVNWYFK